MHLPSLGPRVVLGAGASAAGYGPCRPTANSGSVTRLHHHDLCGTLGRFDRSGLHRGRRETRLGRLRQQRKPRWQRGAKSQIVEYSSAGKVKRNRTVTGHNDGLRFDPTTHQLWALQNEDANPNLLVIDPITGFTVQYTFAAKPPHGGYDDMVFTNGAVYLSASNPTLDAKGNSIGPSIVRATLVAASHTVEVTPVVSGTPQRREHPVRHGQPAQSHRPGLDDSHTLRRDPAG